jgi:hypothetical protein
MVLNFGPVFSRSRFQIEPALAGDGTNREQVRSSEGVSLVAFADGSTLALFRDGTTIRTDGSRGHVLVEAPGFSSVSTDLAVDRNARDHANGQKVCRRTKWRRPFPHPTIQHPIETVLKDVDESAATVSARTSVAAV